MAFKSAHLNTVPWFYHTEIIGVGSVYITKLQQSYLLCLLLRSVMGGELRTVRRLTWRKCSLMPCAIQCTFLSLSAFFSFHSFQHRDNFLVVRCRQMITSRSSLQPLEAECHCRYPASRSGPGRDRVRSLRDNMLQRQDGQFRRGALCPDTSAPPIHRHH